MENETLTPDSEVAGTGKGQSFQGWLSTDALLLLTALIWGFAFVAQRVGMNFIGPFLYNGVRFLLGSLFLVPLLLLRARGKGRGKMGVPYGVLVGLVLFVAASLQQAGLVYTTAGKAGFITGLYVILVPILGAFGGQRTSLVLWVGAALAAVGLYFLSMAGGLALGRGDLLELLGALAWAVQILAIGRLSPRFDPLGLAVTQYLTCSALSLAAAAWLEPVRLEGLVQATWPVIYGGILSIGIAYTLQVVAQQRAHPAHAAILMSLEGFFAALGGTLVLHESLTPRNLLGCGLMLAGMVLAQWRMAGERKTSRGLLFPS